MRWSRHATLVKFLAFAVVMVLLTASLFFIFGQYRTGSTNGYSAVFADASRLKSGDSVRVAGIRVGTVGDVRLQSDKTVLVSFDTDRTVPLTGGTKVAVRYLNLVGDRYLDLVEGPGPTNVLAPGTRITVDRTAPALDLDLLLGGLKPVISGLNPQDVNALTSSLIQAFQGQGDTLEALLSKTSSFSNALGDNNQVIEQLIDNLNAVLSTLGKADGKFGDTIDRIETLISGLSADRDPIGTAITSLDSGTASLASLLTQARAPLAGAVDQLNRLAPIVADDQDRIDSALQKMPNNLRKLSRLGAYGAWFQYYICGVTVRVSDLQGRTAEFPWIKQDTGRCAEPE
ncbi:MULTISPECIES: MCE family protein [unclassified Mycobacterium]|uniref:MCE family protein n=1 Tax=unclassified Mycobacterium TaxID=2642494 RepID=UPI0029C95B20|nr:MULTISPECIES: MCE family protein [unclassified Mycobacterium]